MISTPRTEHRGTPRSFLIIGGGFSGVAAATHLATHATDPIRITLIEPAERIGRGLAYGARTDQWLLNVPAGRLSIDPARPGDFHQWALEAGRASTPDAFLPRAWFGEYAADRLERAIAQQPQVELVRVRDEAVALSYEQDGVRVETRHRATVRAERAILALGNGPTRIPASLSSLAGDPRLLRGPWDEAGLRHLAERAERVLLVGTGLTMFDAAIGLRRLGFRGELLAVSRRGQLARAHGPKSEAAHAEWAAKRSGLGLTTLLHEIRARCEPDDWRGVIDSLRPHTSRIWAELSQCDRARFLTRLAVHWDAHRHRAPPQVHAEVMAMHDAGELRIMTGGIASAHTAGERLVIRLMQPRAGETTVFVDGVVLCIGPEPDPRRWNSPLMDTLITSGLATPDPLGLGLRTDPAGSLIDASGSASERLSTLGPLRRGDLWESTAVPEIAAQAADLAEHLLHATPMLTQTAPPPAVPAPAAPARPSAPS